MIFAWLKRRRRRQLLALPMPSAWQSYLEQNFALWWALSPTEQQKLRNDVRVFVAERHWEGCGGLAMNDEIKVTVAALACYLALHLDHEPFERLMSILVYPSGYVAPDRYYHAGIAVEGASHRLGEAWYRGPVVLSWDRVLHDGRHPGEGENLVWHEFAHQLDMLDRESDGTPPLGSRAQYRQWHDVMTEEFEQLIDDAQAGRPTVLDPYGTLNEAEFFAVCTECFFDRPVALHDHHPKLYDLFREYYRQDPAARRSSSAVEGRQG
jgi:Mlc titration factor MtfA (ptsG expression regulator)